MKSKTTFRTVFTLLLIATSSAAWAGPDPINRFSVASMRYGFNIKADFNYGVPTTGAVPQTTPGGDLYNYDDGYVLTDSSGNAGGQTWYWGYDSGSQMAGNAIMMSTTTVGGSSGDREMDSSTPFMGFDLTYSRGYISGKGLEFGFDVTLGVLPMSFDNTTRFSPVVTTTTDAYGFAGGTTPPSAPYQGSYSGPGFLIDATPSSTSTTMVPGAPVNGYSELDATLWALRIGPSVEFPVNDELSLGLAGGASLGWLNVDAAWNLTGAVNDRGSGSDSETLTGAYLGGRCFWRMNESWRLRAGVEYEYLEDWEGHFGNHSARLDFSQAFYAMFGFQS